MGSRQGAPARALARSPLLFCPLSHQRRVPTRFVQKYTARARRGVELDAEQARPTSPGTARWIWSPAPRESSESPTVELNDQASLPVR